MKQRLRLLYHNERGSYAVCCALLSTLMVTLTAFGLDGAHFLNQKARLSDALEQAALALTAEDSPEKRGNEKRHRQLAREYVRAYMPQLKEMPKIDVHVKPDINDRPYADYVEYHVQAHTVHHAWIASDLYQTFPASLDIADNAVAQKKSTSNKRIVFVLDVSSSMNDFWCEDENNKGRALDFEKEGKSEDVIEQNTGCIRKINRLKRDAMREFHNILSRDKNSRIAIVPFDAGVLYQKKCYMPLVMNTGYHPIQMFYLSDKARSLHTIPESLVNKYQLSTYADAHRTLSLYQLVDVKNSLKYKNKLLFTESAINSAGQLPFYQEEAGRMMRVAGVEHYNHLSHLLLMGFHRPFKDKHGDIFQDSLINDQYLPKLFRNLCLGGSSNNEALLLTNNITQLEHKIKGIGGGGNTVVLSGILFASRLLSEEDDKHTVKKIIFISDTEDNHIDFTNDFIRQGLCRGVRWQLSVIPISHTPKIKWNACLLSPETRTKTVDGVDIPIPAVTKPSQFATSLKEAIQGSEKIGHNIVKD
ncbi:TadE/TadG family type IV pilus assembly protein [Sodalis endosymbiont of Spalangia cameroni]|uniref:TadE/TadG family type IV pilus assembly protein n=1 Tax=Sodalis praecaptivus TaxID=1239307 RepID=UPI0031F9D13C